LCETAHAPSNDHFSVMHAKVYESRPEATGDDGEGEEDEEAQKDDEDGKQMVGRLESKAQALLKSDGDELADEDSKLADAKQYVRSPCSRILSASPQLGLPFPSAMPRELMKVPHTGHGWGGEHDTRRERKAQPAGRRSR
jgi:hypothetical protein